ncbi:mevalonate kinase [Leuconostocaceae bacterium ESL0958]|nr:mevalonate kinase [Leuconostocaceae bacterium ESL0958]
MEEKRIGQGQAHGKAILIGDHAVVYNQPAVAIPLLDLTVAATFAASPAGQMLQLNEARIALDELGADLEGIRVLLNQLLADLALTEQSFLIQVHANIPQERGFGASAALANAITKAAFDFAAQPLTADALSQYVNLAETIAHGSPSGIDAATVQADEPIWFENKKAQPFQSQLQACLVLADTGVRGQTVRAVNIVKEQLKMDYDYTWAAIEDLGALAKQVREALGLDDPTALGAYFTQAHQDLVRLRVSHPKLNQLVDAAIAAGALGAKLTGSGIGGAMLALASNESQAKQIAAALQRAGAQETWVQPLH